MVLPYLRPGQALLDDRFPLPLDAPFSLEDAHRESVSSPELTRLVQAGLVRRPLEGVYVAAQAKDTLSLRADCVRMVLPAGAVVTDRTAGWLHGAPMILAPGDHLVTPKVSVFQRSRGGRYRNDLMASGQRMMPDSDVEELFGLPVTTRLRTVCDLGRMLKRTPALGAMDMMARLGGFTVEEVVHEANRFRGYRWVTQLRTLAPLIDKRAESPAESAVRLRWYMLKNLPPPEPQRPVQRSPWTTYWLDVGNDDLRFAVEYDGLEFHNTAEQLERDRARRRWIRENTDWLVKVVTRENVFGPRADLEYIIKAGVIEARRRLGNIAA